MVRLLPISSKAALQPVLEAFTLFYNHVRPQRLHSKLGNLPPIAFEQKSAIKQPIGMCEKT